jgi:hypothetical protein
MGFLGFTVSALDGFKRNGKEKNFAASVARSRTFEMGFDVHNAYKSTLFGKGRESNVAATRMVTGERDQM